MSREPRRGECTICPTVAPHDVFAVRRDGHTAHNMTAASAQPPRRRPVQHRERPEFRLRLRAAGSLPDRSSGGDPGLVQRLEQRVRPVGAAVDQPELGAARAAWMLV